MNINIKKFLKKNKKNKIVCLTAYSKSVAEILDKFCDLILVGDSMANVLYGMKNTHRIKLDQMIEHGLSVKKGIKKSLLVIDMPKGSYNNILQAKKNAKLIVKKTKCDAIKIENNNKNYKIIKALVNLNIPVMGHVGFTPQYKKKFKVEGKNKKEIKKLLKDAISTNEKLKYDINNRLEKNRKQADALRQELATRANSHERRTLMELEYRVLKVSDCCG